MNKNQYKFTGNDESYTKPELISPIIPFIHKFMRANKKKNITIWCPFDLRENVEWNGIKMFRSNYVDIFEKEGFNVIASHIATGQDFFKFEPKQHWDVIISNPPFKNKRKFFERVISFNKPFALIAPMSWLNDGGVFHLFKDLKLQLLIPDKRSRFFNENGDIGKQPSFKAGYFCRDFLIDCDIQWFELKR